MTDDVHVTPKGQICLERNISKQLEILATITIITTVIVCCEAGSTVTTVGYILATAWLLVDQELKS